jgi:hypothetical protein
MSEPKYQRLTRERTSQLFGVVSLARTSLWLGSDHLLLVEANGYTESYKRFYFRDIQAIIIRTTSTRQVWNWVLGSILAFVVALCVGTGLFASIRNADLVSGPVICFLVALFLLGLPLLINNLLGTTCACQIRTAVQTERLPSIVRLAQAQKILQRIRPHIEAAQGQLSAEDVAARLLGPQTFQYNPPAAESSGVPPVIS